ncbi:polysaccharide deacetylase family protein [Polymorphospora sp. NPDC051019]|uniref:polysaccharide deacetylase family protein n=1 Tax=Polymorphospora sp. NPDC051019 TaxID=3155725 RepID=UPI003415D3CE
MKQRAALGSGVVVLALLLGAGWIASRPTSHPTFRTAPPATGIPAPDGTPSRPATPSSAPPTGTPAATRSAAATPGPTATTSTAPAPLPVRRTTGRKGVALTFDDGPHPVWTPKVLDRLRAARVKATFCVVGSQVHRHPALVARIVREGHTLCNHTWHHELDLGNRPPAEIRANLERTNREIRRAVPDARIPFFRHPGGRWTEAAISVAEELGMASIDWDVDPRDWEKKTRASEITERVLKKARPGSIVLLHDGGGDRAATLDACAGLIGKLQDRYEIILLDT